MYKEGGVNHPLHQYLTGIQPENIVKENSEKSRMGKHKQVACQICFNFMRSDHVKGHMKVHQKYSPTNDTPQSVEDICRDLVLEIVSKVVAPVEETSGIKRKHVEVECEAQTTIDEKALEIAALKINKEYEEKVELGKALFKILNKGVVQEESFPPEWQRALDLYLKQGHQIDHETVVLKPWQMELMKHIDNPSDRKILWVQGEKCGEGKTWFQKYVQSLLGRRRVVAGGINIHSNSASIAHALSKRPLATTDIFLFNIGKARNREQEVNYSFIEDLKDGNVFASKYDSKELMIRVPNIVMVFSNSTPDVEELARDRWEIFSIENDELVKRQISKSCPPVVLTSNKKKKYPQDSDNDSDSDY